jgi:hypothetical protein
MSLGVVEWVVEVETSIPIDSIDWEVRVADDVTSSEQEEGVRRFGVAAAVLGRTSYWEDPTVLRDVNEVVPASSPYQVRSILRF